MQPRQSTQIGMGTDIARNRRVPDSDQWILGSVIDEINMHKVVMSNCKRTVPCWCWPATWISIRVVQEINTTHKTEISNNIIGKFIT